MNLWGVAAAATFFSFLSVARGYTDSAIFRQNFEDPTDEWDFDNLIRVQDFSKDGIAHGHILRVDYPPDDRGSPRATHRFALDEQVKSATLSYDVKFHSRFYNVRGGKMHGLGGGTLTTGCAPVDPNGWSVRLMWRRDGVPELYVYHQDRVERCGDRYKPRNGKFKFKKGKWYRIDLQVRMNSSPNLHDGRAALYINGEQIVGVNNLRLSGNKNVVIDSFKFGTFFGGSSPEWAPPKTTYIYWDNFTVRKDLKVTGKRGTECEIYLGGIYDPSEEVCCDNSCGSCGGAGCGGLPGGITSCCTKKIKGSEIMCESVTVAPCNYNESL